MRDNSSAVKKGELSYWEIRAPKARRDFIIKKIAIAIIATLNFSVLAAALYLILTYCPISTQAMIASPFIVGVVAALTYLKFPTCGVSTLNYTQYSNPATILGKIVTYIFFGPYMYAVKRCDWTLYHDLETAHLIADYLKNKSFEVLADKYGKHFRNFAKYGMIPPENEKELINLYNSYAPVKKELERFKQKGLESNSRFQAVTKEKNSIEKRWLDLQKTIEKQIFLPEIPKRDFSSPITILSLNVVDYLSAPPFETV
ncbi:MAG: hypothetical protein JJU12_08235 [Chlamydiales bacterium]|nr:hypothetical protein [Chlamydiales bacterium]